MKRYIVIFILSLCVMACDRHSEHNETLTQAEALIVEHPDSALIILQKIEIEKNDYGQMLLHYARGRIQYENEDYPASIISFFNAEKIAKEYNNNFILGLIYHSVSCIYGNAYNYIEQQNYAQMAYDHFILSGNDYYILLGLEILAEALYNNKDYDRCVALSQQLIEKATENKNEPITNRGQRLLSRSYIKVAKYEEAKDVLLRLKTQTSNLTSQDYRNLCLAYIKIGELDSANVYRRFAQTENHKSLWVVIKNPKTGDPIANIYDLEKPITSVDSTTHKIINLNLAQTVANHHAYKQSLQEAELKSERMSKFVIVAIAILLILFISIWYHLHLKAHRKEIEIKMLEAENIRNILKVTKEDASAMQQSVNQLFEQNSKPLMSYVIHTMLIKILKRRKRRYITMSLGLFPI